jgi:putative membrane protein
LAPILSTLLGVFLFAAVLVLNRHDLSGAAGALRQAPAGLAISVLVHIPQLVLTALAWRCLLARSGRPGLGTMVQLRWIRESLNTLVLGGAFIGQTVAALRLARGGVPADLAGATATVDMTVEAGTQALITLIGLVLLLAGGGSPVPGSIAALDIALALAAVAAMVALQRNLPVGLLQRAFARLAPRWAASKPGWLVDFQGSIRRVHADRITLFRAACYHLCAWTLGAVEVSGILLLLGHPLSLVDGFVVESLTQALRSAAFMIPGGLGAQEAAIIASCGLVGVPADAALTLALLRRARELLIGLLGLCALRRMQPKANWRPMFVAPTISPSSDGG